METTSKRTVTTVTLTNLWILPNTKRGLTQFKKWLEGTEDRLSIEDDGDNSILCMKQDDQVNVKVNMPYMCATLEFTISMAAFKQMIDDHKIDS